MKQVPHILHIAGWYPNVDGPHETPFVPRHIDALRSHCTNTVWHIEVRTSERWRLVRRKLHADRTFLLYTGVQRWRVAELCAAVLLLWAWLTRDRSVRFDGINAHIAYPNLVHWRWLRLFIRVPLVITEHWSAYHTGFNNARSGMSRIRRIFHQGTPVITVSRALAHDIAAFAGPPQPRFHVVDNAVDPAVFTPRAGTDPQLGRFFAVAGWRSPKRPDLLLDALALLRDQGLPARLRLAGDGPKMKEILARIDTLGLQEHVDLLGQLDARAVADELRLAHALVHASDYETYSAVCAEALCCGTPVIASRVGGIPEFLTGASGALVPANTREEWDRCWKAAWHTTWAMDRGAISRAMLERAGIAGVGLRYFNVLREAFQLAPAHH